MTKLQVLNAYFTERLMVAVHEIMKVVADTLFEYQDESERTKRENEILRRRLRDVGFDTEAAFPQPPPPLPVERVSEQQQWGSTGPGSGSTLTAVKLEFPEPQRNRREEEEEHSGQEEEQRCGPEPAADGSVIPSPCSKRERDQDSLNRLTFPSPCSKRDQDSLNQPKFPSPCSRSDQDSLNQPTFPSPCSKSDQDSLNHPTFLSPYGKRDRRPNSQNPPDVRLQIGNAEEEEPVLVKTETSGVDCDISEQAVKPLLVHIFNPDSETDQSQNSGWVNEDMNNDHPPMMYIEQHFPQEKADFIQGESSLSCVYCGKVFIHVSRLKSHLRTHTEERSFRCGVCRKCFSQARLLAAHQRVHTTNKPYSCNICSKSFNYLAKFKEHQRIHTGERPYCCSFCGKYFSQSGHLKAHVRIHTGEKPYRCPACGSCFSQLNQIKRHLLTHAQDVSAGNNSPSELC